MYAHFLFNAFDMDRSGSIRFEVKKLVAEKKSFATSKTRMAAAALKHAALQTCASFVRQELTFLFLLRRQDFVIGLSVLLRGSVTEKLRWAFNLYDINKDGYITKEARLARKGAACARQASHKGLVFLFFFLNKTYLPTSLCLHRPAGNVGNNDLRLRHDGQVHLTFRARGLPLRARGEILPGASRAAASERNGQFLN